MDSLLKNRSALVALALVAAGVVLGAALKLATAVAITIVAAAAVAATAKSARNGGHQPGRCPMLAISGGRLLPP